VNPLAGTDDRDLPSSILQRFRSARESDHRARLADFVLPVGHPMHVSVLVALIRFDRTWHRDRGQDKSLDDYRHDFPTLFDDPDAVRAVTMADGETGHVPLPPPPALWHPSAGRLAETGDSWPGPFRLTNGTPAGADGNPAGTSLHDAAELYHRFRETNNGADARDLSDFFASARAEAPTLDLFRDIHRSHPAFADRLARAVSSMPVPGRDFLGFRLETVIGRGAFGRVFLARQRELANRLVVLKVTAERAGESQTLAQLQHTNIVPIYSVHAQDPFVGLCMPYFGTTTMADIVGILGSGAALPQSGKQLVTTLNSRRKMTEARGTPAGSARTGAGLPVAAASEPAATDEGTPKSARGRGGVTLEALEGFSYVHAVLWIGARLADGLRHAHARGILHRDLKPANVLLTDDGQPMLLDFNLSEDTKLRGSAAAARAGGTLPYMSPEQLETFRDGRPLDERSDLYALGLILFELLTGKPAFPWRHGSSDVVVEKMLVDRKTGRPRLRCHNGRVSPAVESIVLHCLEYDPARRYRSARDLQEDIERHLADRPLKHAPEPSLRERAGKWRRRHPRLASSSTVAAGCGVVLLAAAALFAVRLQHVRRLEALDNLAGFRGDVQAAGFLLNKPDPDRDPKDLDEGVRLVTGALARYHVLDNGRLDDRLPAVHYLPSDGDREALRAEAREALQTLARASGVQAERERDQGRRREKAEHGLRVLGLACTGGDGATKAELLQSADLNRQLGNEQESIRLEQEAEALTPRTSGELLALAVRLSDHREFNRALKLLRESTRRNPRDVWAWFYQGYCLQQLDVNQQEAVSCYTASLALAPQHTNRYLALFNRGLTYVRLQHYTEAIADFDEAARVRPDSAEAVLNRGIARAEMATGQYAEAIADYDEALRIDPSVRRVYFLRAYAREKAGDSEGARRDRAEGMRGEPTDELSWIDRAVARIDTEPAAALADLNRALEINPNSLLALQNKAHVLGEDPARQEEAVAVLNKEVALYPDFVRGRIGRGVHLARLGRRTEALADARESLARSSHAETYYQAANIYSLTSRQNPEDALQCFPLLWMALQGGFGLEFVDKDSDFDPVRSHPEFRRVVKAARELRAAARKSDE
jgi:serine/threonine protein kinase/tetratricopeptide (TPR) repeat protein